ncbi:hypothetical protein AAHB49_06350 [Bacillus cereus]
MKKRRISTRNVEAIKENKLYDFDFQQAYDYFLSAKKSEGLREKRLSVTKNIFVFLIWLTKYYPGMQKISEVTTYLIREYMVYMKEEHVNFKTGRPGLSTQTINARVRFLKTMYNLLYERR